MAYTVIGKEAEVTHISQDWEIFSPFYGLDGVWVSLCVFMCNCTLTMCLP